MLPFTFKVMALQKKHNNNKKILKNVISYFLKNEKFS